LTLSTAVNAAIRSLAWWLLRALDVMRASFLIGLSTVAALGLVSPTALAQRAPKQPEPTAAESSAPPPPFEVGASVAFLGGGNVVAWAFGADASYRFAPALGVGAYYQRLTGEPYSSDYCSNEGKCFDIANRAGALLTLHPLPSALIDPWVALQVGAIYLDPSSYEQPDDAYKQGWGLDFSATLGAEVHIASFGVGPFAQLITPLAAHAPTVGGLGVRLSGRF